MFSLIKTKWGRAREHFDALQKITDTLGMSDIDKDFIIRGLLTVADVPTAFDVNVIEKHWDAMESRFAQFGNALRAAIDFCRSPDVRIYSASLLQPVGTLFPIIYFLSRQKNGSVPDSARAKLRSLIYFLLINGFLGGRSPEARIRYLRDVLQAHPGSHLPLDALLDEVARRQRNHAITTAPAMLGWNPRVTLNIAQPMAAQDTLSWQEKAEVDHIFPQSLYRPKFGNIVDDIGNLAYLGKLRNIRKSAEEPSSYFAKTSDAELKQYFLIEDRLLLAPERFETFVEKRRQMLLAVVRDFLGR
jgi:hypothetical protein